jgi:hypothetical protein
MSCSLPHAVEALKLFGSAVGVDGDVAQFDVFVSADEVRQFRDLDREAVFANGQTGKQLADVA